MSFRLNRATLNFLWLSYPGEQLEIGHPGLQLELGHPGLQLELGILISTPLVAGDSWSWIFLWDDSTFLALGGPGIALERIEHEREVQL